MTKRKLFGTDGIRGIANSHPMTPEMALRIGKAAAMMFKDNRRHKIVIGKDTRLSGYIIETALTSGICSMGCDVLLVGPMPTPAIAQLTRSLVADAAIVISASHNPAEHNGIKFFSSEGVKLPDETEEEMERNILSEDISSAHIKGELIGKARRIDDAQGRYIEFAKSCVKGLNLEGMKIVLDCANGATYKVAPLIFKELGAEVIVLNDKPDGLNINDKCGSTYIETCRAAVVKNKADIGISFDGDGDRVIMVDEKGQIFDGDNILAACGLYLKEKGKLAKNTIVGTVMSNYGLEKFCKENNIILIRTNVGDRYVIEEMLKNGFNLGGEQSGHIIFGDHNTTGDGIIGGLLIVKVMKDKKKKLSQLKSLIAVMPQVLINVEVKEKRKFDKEIEDEIDNAKEKLKGRVLVRYSGTENLCRVMVEGEDNKIVEEIAKKIANKIKEKLGK